MAQSLHSILTFSLTSIHSYFPDDEPLCVFLKLFATLVEEIEVLLLNLSKIFSGLFLLLVDLIVE